MRSRVGETKSREIFKRDIRLYTRISVILAALLIATLLWNLDQVFGLVATEVLLAIFFTGVFIKTLVDRVRAKRQSTDDREDLDEISRLSTIAGCNSEES